MDVDPVKVAPALLYLIFEIFVAAFLLEMTFLKVQKFELRRIDVEKYNHKKRSDIRLKQKRIYALLSFVKTFFHPSLL